MNLEQETSRYKLSLSDLYGTKDGTRNNIDYRTSTLTVAMGLEDFMKFIIFISSLLDLLSMFHLQYDLLFKIL